MGEPRPNIKLEPQKVDSIKTTDPTPCVEPERIVSVLDSILGTFQVEISACLNCYGKGYITLWTKGYGYLWDMCLMCKGRGATVSVRRLPDDTLQT